MPRSAFVTGLFALAALAVLGTACGLIEGVGDFRVGLPQDAGPDVLDGRTPGDSGALPESSMTAPESSTMDAPADGPTSDTLDTASADTAPPDTSGGDACVPSGPEVCTDGIDNDCNGLIDCADPACAAYACVAEPPAGWALVAFEASGRAPCPSGYGPAVNVVVDPSLGPDTCSCDCTVSTPPSCTTGELAVYEGAPCTTLAGDTPANGGACTARSLGNDFHMLTAAPPTGGSCASSTVIGAPEAGTKGDTCALSGPVGGGCSAGEGCVLAQAQPLQTCIAQTGSGLACPPAFPTAHEAGSSLTDTRGCATCSACGAPTTSCTNATMLFYSDALCTTLVDTLLANGTCDSTPVAAMSYMYSATATAQCGAATPGQPTGSATLNSPETICCP